MIPNCVRSGRERRRRPVMPCVAMCRIVVCLLAADSLAWATGTGKYSPGCVDRTMRSQNSDASRYFASQSRLAASLARGKNATTALLPQAATDAITTPSELWRGIDVVTPPLEIETIHQWSDASGSYEKLRFTSEVSDGVPARVFAIRGIPSGHETTAGILHIHGGGQTASADWVRFWVERGYVAASFDFGGPWKNRAEVTDWGPIRQANMAQAAGGFQVRPTPRESSWFHWALASRRALTLLAETPRVDRQRLGIFGISVGGTLCWLVAAADDRVRTAAPIYGVGYNHDNRRARFGFGRLSEELGIYKKTLSPEAHAPLIRCPIFFLNATNDFHGPLDFAFETLAAAGGDTRWAFTPRTNHHVAPREARDLPLWMAWQLRDGPAWPAAPRLILSLDGSGVTQATVSADRAAEVAQVEVLYSLEDRLPAARYWRTAQTQDQAPWTTSLPVMDVNQRVLAFATVVYRSGVSLASNVAVTIPRQLGAARATLSWTPELADGSDRFAHWYFTSGATDPNSERTYLKVASDGDEPFVTMNPAIFDDRPDFRLSTHLIGDPQHRGRPGDSLQFAYRGVFPNGLTIRIIERDWSPRAKPYSARLSAAPVPTTWQTVELSLDQFRAADDSTAVNWQTIDKLEIEADALGDPTPGFKSFRWTTPAHVDQADR